MMRAGREPTEDAKRRIVAACGTSSLKSAGGHRFFLNPYEDASFTRCPNARGTRSAQFRWLSTSSQVGYSF